jgi:hypothetical protein
MSIMDAKGGWLVGSVVYIGGLPVFSFGQDKNPVKFSFSEG